MNIYEADEPMREKTMEKARPLLLYLKSMDIVDGLNVLVALTAQIMLDAKLKPGSVPMDLWSRDVEPAIRKTIEGNMPDWQKQQELREAAYNLAKAVSEGTMPLDEAVKSMENIASGAGVGAEAAE